MVGEISRLAFRRDGFDRSLDRTWDHFVSLSLFLLDGLGRSGQGLLIPLTRKIVQEVIEGQDKLD